jgi:hypothetical protein
MTIENEGERTPFILKNIESDVEIILGGEANPLSYQESFSYSSAFFFDTSPSLAVMTL